MRGAHGGRGGEVGRVREDSRVRGIRDGGGDDAGKLFDTVCVFSCCGARASGRGLSVI